LTSASVAIQCHPEAALAVEGSMQLFAKSVDPARAFALASNPIPRIQGSTWAEFFRSYGAESVGGIFCSSRKVLLNNAI
jgi:hypothetical protein